MYIIILIIYLIQDAKYWVILFIEVSGSIIIGITMGYLRYIQISHKRPFNAMKSTISSLSVLEIFYFILLVLGLFFPSFEFQIIIEGVSLILLSYATTILLSLYSFKVKVILPDVQSDYLRIETHYRYFVKIKSRFLWMQEENAHVILILTIRKKSFLGRFGIPISLEEASSLNPNSRYICLAIDKGQSNLNLVKLNGFEQLLQSEILFYDITGRKLSNFLNKISEFAKLEIIGFPSNSKQL